MIVFEVIGYIILVGVVAVPVVVALVNEIRMRSSGQSSIGEE